MKDRQRRHLAGAAGSLVVAGLLVAAALLGLGRPDGGAAADFLGSSRPTYSETFAALGIVVWVLVGAVVAMQLAAAIRRVTGTPERLHSHRVRAGSALLLGLLIFVGGALRHQARPVPLCCGDMEAAQTLLH